MPYRKVPLAQGEIYHVFTRSISEFKIFNSDVDFERMLGAAQFYTMDSPPCKFSVFQEQKQKIDNHPFQSGLPEKIVQILVYCIMPTHIHLVIEQLKEDGISRFLNLILKSYSRYFNLKHNRKGPLWEARFKNVLVERDEQFLHLTRYIHLNPVSASLVNRPEDWRFSSYREYLGLIEENKKICNFSDYFNMDIHSYQEFVNGRIDEQRELEKIKHLILD